MSARNSAARLAAMLRVCAVACCAQLTRLSSSLACLMLLSLELLNACNASVHQPPSTCRKHS